MVLIIIYNDSDQFAHILAMIAETFEYHFQVSQVVA